MNKIILNCGRKRKMTRVEAKGQVKAREIEDPGRKVKIYLCKRCNYYHTTTDYRGYNRIRWDRLTR